MNWLASTAQNPTVVGAIAALLVLVLALLIKRRRGSAPAPCTMRSQLLAPNERALLETLRSATGADIEVWPHVHAAAVLVAQSDAPRRQRRDAERGLAHHRFDFVLVSANGHALAAVRCAQPRGHSAGEALKAMCERAGLPLVALDPNASYATDTLREHLQWHMRGPAQEGETGVDAEGRREPVIDLPRE